MVTKTASGKRVDGARLPKTPPLRLHGDGFGKPSPATRLACHRTDAFKRLSWQPFGGIGSPRERAATASAERS